MDNVAAAARPVFGLAKFCPHKVRRCSFTCFERSLLGGRGDAWRRACTWLAVVGVEVPGFLAGFGHDGAFEKAVDRVDLWND